MGSYANLQGSGPVAIFTDGKEVHGTWSRGPSKADVVKYQTVAGQTINLTPGSDVGRAAERRRRRSSITP